MDKKNKKQISRDDVRVLGLLARITLEEEELPLFTAEFEKIIDYVSVLSGLDTSGTEPAYRGNRKNNIMRSDETEPGLSSEDLLANAPDKTGSFFKVPKIL